VLINKFIVPSNELEDVGLQAIEMKKLGRFVALTGKNGAGKSRILNKLIEFIEQRNAYTSDPGNIDRNIQTYKDNLTNNPDSEHKIGWNNELHRLTRQRIIAKERLFSNIVPLLGVLRFVPTKLDLADSRNQTKMSLKGCYEATKVPGFNGFETNCFPYIQQVQDKEWNATHPRIPEDSIAKQEAIKEYKALTSLIKVLLKTELSRTFDGDATLFAKPLYEAGLSDGQKMLIQLAVALHAQKGKLDNTVFILDEPENHLHPSALIDFLENLANVAQNSQFWISTHSVPLLAYIAHKEPMSIWFVEDSKVNNAGSKPEHVLHGLLGDDEQIGNLNAFTSLPAQYAAIKFASECLIDPKVSNDGKGDPQVAQINELLQLDATSPISLMDYGAGKCRLLLGLEELAEERGNKLPNLMSYFAYDKSPENKAYSLTVINSIYQEKIRRYFLSKDDFFSNKEKKSIDIVVICNVMHEIIPNDWLTLFDQHSLIYRSLKDTGSVLIVEDQRIPIGEKAHKFGFIVLDTAHLRTLFSIKEEDCNIGAFHVFDHRNDGRLKAHKISKELIRRVNAESRKSAIEEVKETAIEKIKELREAKPDYRNGQLHGFWTQQFANASLWLAEQ
jgi:energy-coupling factor transporter ATP-binding protein EcfA2